MRSSVKALSVVAALAMAFGLSACDEEEVSQPSSGGASASSSAKADSDESDASPSDDSQEDKDSKGSKDDKKSQDSKGKSGETTKSGSTIQNIQPVTFKDEEIGLTQTCDKVIEDYAAPKYKASRDSDTVYLLHCTLDFSGDIAFSNTIVDSTSLQDKTESRHKADESGALLADDLKDDGLEVFDSEDSGSTHVEGWVSMATVTESTKLKPFSEGTTSIVYDRAAGKGIQSGKQYAAYSDTQDLVLK